jgi:hypothetical protein
MKSSLNQILIFSAELIATFLIYYLFNFEIAILVILTEIATNTYIKKNH